MPESEFKPKQQLFSTPFSAAYWRLAAAEMKSTRMLVLAAVLTALRIAVKSLSIPIGPNLNITFGFLINSIGSMIYGPVVAILTSAVSDTLGAILFPSGPYYFPFIFEEIAGGVFFALFFYRAKISTMRVLLGRFSVTLVCNLILNPILLYYYYLAYMGTSYNIFSLPRMVKNLALFPVQSLVMVILFNAVLPLTNRRGLTYTGNVKLKFGRKEVAALVILTAVSALAVAGYYWYRGLA
ncbi:MAG: folate family ECF transporter S component [Oscillospiraceae bacterium]|nr:folate family ECF transporter S component [Oscillospiraceae bacterium]